LPNVIYFARIGNIDLKKDLLELIDEME